MLRPTFSREEQRHLQAMRKQILRCLDLARLLILLGFRELAREPADQPRRRRRPRKGTKALAWAALAGALAFAVVNIEGDRILDVNDLVLAHEILVEGEF